jgi:hypothetical protein
MKQKYGFGKPWLKNDLYQSLKKIESEKEMY